MKTFILVLALVASATLIVWAGTPIPGTVVAAKITTGNTDNTFSIGDTIEMLGTCKEVADLTARDAIPAERRAEGMQCWVVANSTAYRLIGGIANANWQVQPPVGLPANASGALTNDGAGVLGWYPGYALATASITVNGTANHITTTSATIALGGSATLDIGSDVATQSGNNAFSGNNTFSKTNYTSANFTTSTNQNQITPDFSVAEQLISTNAAFTFLAPVGVDGSGKIVQWTLVNVTNTTAAAVLITSPANCHTVGTAYVTNWTAVWFQCYGGKITNAYFIPVF